MKGGGAPVLLKTSALATVLLVTLVLVTLVLVTLVLAPVGSVSASSGGAIVTAVAGTGALGDEGDGGMAIHGALADPTGIAVDRDGDVAVADTGNCRVQLVAARAGRHFGILMKAQHVYSVAGAGCRPPHGSRSSSPALEDPTGVAFDGAGDLFMADASGNRILELPAVSGPDLGLAVRADHLTTVAGAGASRLDDPQGIAVDGAGDLFVADTAGCQVDEIPDHAVTESDGVVHRPGHLFAVAGTAVCGYGGDGGPATAARLWSPSAVAVDSSGNVLIADEGNSAVREVAAVTGTYYGVAITAGDIATVAGQDTNSAYLADGLSATGDISALNYPSGVAVDAAGNLFVADSYDRCIRMVPAASGSLFGRSVTVGDMYTLVGVLPTGGGSVPLGNGTRWILARVTYPAAVAAGPGGVLYFSDDGANTVRRVTGS